MRRNWKIAGIVLVLLGIAGEASAQVGDVTRVHDPCVIEAGGKFYLYQTGNGVPVRVSEDLYHWKNLGRVFEASPAWTQERVANVRYFWAPDISYFDGRYHLYYSVSSFGVNNSSIGLATNVTLDPADPKYQWVDGGEVIRTVKGKDNWNAIDPAVCLDEAGTPWMALGSFWSGLKLIRLDPKTGLRAEPDGPVIALATRPRSKQGAIEAAFLTRRGAYYYLWASADLCCKSVDSTYHVVVGRSKKIEGPYLDIDGKPMLEGGGTDVLSGYDTLRGPGHNAVLTANGADYLVHHFYDATRRGMATLQIRPIAWDDAGWPLAHEPIHRPINAPPATRPSSSLEGAWSVWTTLGDPKILTFRPDGTLADAPTAKSATVTGKWERAADTLTLHWGLRVIRCYLADDAESFVGRDSTGTALRARRNHATTQPG